MPFLHCPRCARRTPVPTWRRRGLQIAVILTVVATWGFVIWTYWREN